ncbi:hypothetical protein HDU98_004471 [Podochytrium sp. JEL0797]|nr:hypothetical protein HDU98_004471 [Podochytrium sp. JEL0797]
MTKNKSGAQKRRDLKARQQRQAEELLQSMMPQLTPAQMAARMIREQKHKAQQEAMQNGTYAAEQAALAAQAVGKQRRAPLLDGDDALLPNVSTALLEIFCRFDDDNDGALNRLELERFAIATNGEKFEEEAIEELKKSFNVNADGHLTRAGFLEMYQLQTLSDPGETWRDLIKHGYSINIKLVNRITGSADPAFAKDLALTNKHLTAANLATLSAATLLDPPSLLAYLRTLAAATSAQSLALKQTHMNLAKQLKHARSQSSLLDKDKRAADVTLKTVKELSRKLVVRESELAGVQLRCKNLEHEIGVVRRDFAVGAGGLQQQQGGLVRRRATASSLRQQQQQQATTQSPKPAPAVALSATPPSPIPTRTPTPVTQPSLIDKDLAAASLAHQAAEIARKYACVYAHDASSVHAATVAVGRATALAEEAVAHSSVAVVDGKGVMSDTVKEVSLVSVIPKGLAVAACAAEELQSGKHTPAGDHDDVEVESPSVSNSSGPIVARVG